MNKQTSNNQDIIVIDGADEQIKISKKDLVWQKGDHDHHYLPDFSDETEDYIALKCAKPGCVFGALYRKDNQDFVNWVDTHRPKS